MLNINDLRQLHLGEQGENHAQTITIDMNPWLADHPGASAAIWHKGNGDSVPSATGAEFDSVHGTISWSPSSTDTVGAGKGEAEIRLIGGTCEVARNSAFADLYYRNMLEAGMPEYTEEELAFAREIQAALDPDVLVNEIRAYGTGEAGMAAGVEPRDHWMKVPVNSGSDAGDLSYIMPTMSAEFAAWAMGCSPHTWQACACSGTTLGEKGAFYAGRAMAGTAYDLLHDPEARERITAKSTREMLPPYFGRSVSRMPFSIA